MRSLLLSGIAFVVGALSAAEKMEPADIAARLRSVATTHPRLFLPASDEAALRRHIAGDPLMAKAFAMLRYEAEQQLATKPVERVLIGRRLLDKSRTCLSRVLHLGLAWRLTGERKYLERARVELIAVAQFADWNPSHFLDVAEMTAAVGIGYDWFFNELDEPTRALLRGAIVEKGLRASLRNDSWTRATHNWNQVCNGGITVGALAVAESEQALAAQLVARAINTMPTAMHAFAPDGAYPEGPGYWGYGMTYNVLLISALQSVFDTDFGLSREPGFLATADYYLHVHGPSGLFFNYSDCGRGGGQTVSPAMFWFAAQRKEPYLLWNELPKLTDPRAPPGTRGRSDRVDPMLLLWMTPGLGRPPPPPTLSWTGRGSIPVAFHRGGWTRDASFVAIKGGSPSVNHAHMDVGAFVMDADGVRWADDLGMQDYNSLESKGVDLWGKGPDGQRWKVFRLGSSAHNVLVVDGRQQRVDGDAPIVLAKTDRTIVDTSRVYRGQLANARRGVVLQGDGSVRVQDEFTTLAQPASVRWAMVTFADVRIAGEGCATLSQQGKQLTVRVLEPAGVTLRIYLTDPPPAPTDARNPGSRMIGFEIAAAAARAQRIVVQLQPSSSTSEHDAPVVSLAQW